MKLCWIPLLNFLNDCFEVNISDLLDKILVTEKKYPLNVFEEKRKSYTFINPYAYHLYRKNRVVYDSFDGFFVDGILMILLIRIFYFLKITRRSFDWTSVSKDLFNRCSKTKESIFLVGAKENEIANTVENLKNEFPEISIAGFRNGYFSNDQDLIESVEKIVSLKPDYVIVGMGAVRQENFILKLQMSGYAGISFSCGGYIHQASKDLNYYPNWVNKYHLRAFYRLFHERGLFKRLFNVLIQFPLLFIYDFFYTSKKWTSTQGVFICSFVINWADVINLNYCFAL